MLEFITISERINKNLLRLPAIFGFISYGWQPGLYIKMNLSNNSLQTNQTRSSQENITILNE